MSWTTLTFPSSTVLSSTKMTQLYNDTLFLGKEFNNLVISRPSVTTIDVNADYLALTDSNVDKVIVNSLDLTLDITVSGKTGIDSGSEVGSATYAIWAAYSSASDETTGFLSRDFVTPVMSTSFDFKKLIGITRNNGPDLAEFFQYDDKVQWFNDIQALNVSSLALNTFIPLDLSLFSGTANFCKFMELEYFLDSNAQNEVVDRFVTVNIRPNSVSEDITVIDMSFTHSGQALSISAHSTVVLGDSQIIDWKVAGPSTTTSRFLIRPMISHLRL